MKTLRPFFLAAVLVLTLVSIAGAQTTYTLNVPGFFGSRGDGSIQPGDSIGTNPQNGNTVNISAQLTAGVVYGLQPGDPASATNGFNMRGVAFDPVSGNLVFVDTHSGTGGSATIATNAAIYILSTNSGQIIGALNTNGIAGGSYTHVVPGVADDGVVFICNQVTSSSNSAFKIYRWPTADTNNVNFSQPPTVVFSNTFTPSDRLGEAMSVRGAGTNTQILASAASQNGTGTNVYLFTTVDGTNFTSHRIFFTGNSSVIGGNTVIYPAITAANWLGDGIAFGPTNTFFAKNVGGPFLCLSYDPVTFVGSIISEFAASSASGTDPLLNMAGIAVDNTHHLLGTIEEIGGTASGGRGKVWLFDISDPTNRAPAVLSSRTYIPNFTKATATMGYVCFGTGMLFANVVNNGMQACSVDSISMPGPSFSLPADLPGGPVRVTDLSPTTRVAVGSTIHLEAFATPDVTSYQWYSNGAAITGATSYYMDVTNAITNFTGTVYWLDVTNAAGSAESVHTTLTVVSAANFFHPVLLWSETATSSTIPTNALTYNGSNIITTNFITSNGGANTPNERTIAYNPISNQVLVVRGPAAFASLKIFVMNADNPADTNFPIYLLKTNGIVTSTTLTLCGIGVADDGAVYAATTANDTTFKVYRWPDTGPNTLPQLIFGTNSSAAVANPVGDLTSVMSRFGDALAVHGAGNSTEIIVDSQNDTRLAGILRPVPDNTMTNWTQTGYLAQNISGSYGFQAYGTSIGRSLQFGPNLNGPLGNVPTYWQKRYNASGAPLAAMGYNAGGGVSGLDVANTSLPFYTNGPVGISFTLNLAAAVSFTGPNAISANNTSPEELDFYDLTNPSQAVLLSRQNLPGSNAGGRTGNANAVSQVIFGANPGTGTNYIFALDGNNGIAAYYLSGGVTPPPKLLTQPKDLQILQGSSASLTAQVDQIATIKWYQGTNSPVDTGVTGPSFALTNVQFSNAGAYFMVATNLNGSVTSRVAQVSVVSAGDNYSLTPVWSAIANNPSYPYVTSTGGGNTPTERAFAYNARSNQLIVVSLPILTHNYNIYVVDGSTGSNLYTLNTNGIINEGASEVAGLNPLDLLAVAVADDGAVYVCSETPNASGGSSGDTTKMLHIYRWADSGPTTTNRLVYQGDPANLPAGINERWGDVMAARGSGTNTQLLLNTQDGAYGSVLVPTDSTMAQFTNFWFADSGGAGSIGRSIQFGTTNTVFEKHKAASLVNSSYNTNTQSSSAINSVDSTSTLGGLFVSTTLNLAAGVDFIGTTTAPLKPDAVALYDISSPTTPVLIKEYNFPSNQVANANFISQTVISGLRVYSLDGNNGLMAFFINPPVNSMVLHIVPAGANVNLSWGSPVAILQGSATLNPTSWADLTTLGQTNSVQSASAKQFYRLIVRR